MAKRGDGLQSVAWADLEAKEPAGRSSAGLDIPAQA
jgi:hypothetical protein